MTRAEFVMAACVAGIRSVENEALRRAHVRELKATAELLADELGLPEGACGSGVQEQRDRAGDALAESLAKVTEIARQRAIRIEELEAQLEQATAPAAKVAPKGGRS